MKFHRLLPEYLSVNPIWVDVFDDIETVLNEHMFDPAKNLASLQDDYLLPEDAFDTLNSERLLKETDLKIFEKDLLLKLSDDIGFQWENNTYFSDLEYARLLRYLAKYWSVSGTTQFIKFLSYVFNTQLEYEQLWTKNYQELFSGQQIISSARFFREGWSDTEQLYPTPRTNLFASPDGPFSTPTWTLQSITVQAGTDVVSPYGGDIAFLKVNTEFTSHRLSQDITLEASTTYTFSLYISPKDIAKIKLSAVSLTSSAAFEYDFLTEASVTTGILRTPVIKKLSHFHNWYRCSISFIPSKTEVFTITLQLGEDWSVGTGTNGVYVFGFQCEDSLVPTSLIKTGNVPITDYVDTGTSIIFSEFAIEPDMTLKIASIENLNNSVGLPTAIFGRTTYDSSLEFPYNHIRQTGKRITESGDWYPTSHVQLKVDIERFNVMPMDVFSSFFYTFAPIHLILHRLVLSVLAESNLNIAMHGSVRVRDLSIVPKYDILNMIVHSRNRIRL